MPSSIRRIIEMVLRVLGFVHANPSDDPVFQAVATRLEDRAARLQALEAQERTGHIEVDSAVITKKGLRAAITDSLTLLARLAATATREEPTMPVRLTLPKPKSSERTFLAGSRVVVTEALAHQELLARWGMTAGFLDQMTTLLNQFEQAIGTKSSGVSAHVGAHAELEELVVEVSRLVRLLDAIQRPRFRNDPDKRAAWSSARTVVRHTPKPEPEPGTPSGDPLSPAA